MSVSKPQILLLQLGNQFQIDTFNHSYTGLCTKMEEQYTVTKASSLTEEHLAQSKAIILVDGGLTRSTERSTQIKLSEYAKAGGSLIFACLFSSFTYRSSFNKMCETMNLPWGRGESFRDGMTLNPAFASVFGKEAFKTLEQSYSMKAVNLINIRVTSKVYVPTEDSRIQSIVFPPHMVDTPQFPAPWKIFPLDMLDTPQTPAVWHKYGQGHIAYIGDVNNETGSQALIIAMLSKCLTL